jgi:hypothetical protein
MSTWKRLHRPIYVTLVLAWLGCFAGSALAQRGPGLGRDGDDPGLARAGSDRSRISWAGDAAYVYPIRPGTADWKALQSHNEMVQVTQVDESLLASMSDEGLVRTVLSYPLLGDVLAYNSPQQGFDAIRSQFGGLRALLEREGAAEVLLRRYQKIDAADIPAVLSLEEQGRRARDLSYVELLLAQPEILAGMDDSLLDELLLETLVKREQKLKRLEVYGFAGLERAAFTAVRALERAQPGPTRNKGSQTMNVFLETGGPASLEVLDSVFARTEKVVFGSSNRALSKRSGLMTKDYSSTVYTPKGSAVAVIVMTFELSSTDIASCNSYYSTTYPSATRLRDCSRRYNCHSYAWNDQSTSNTVWINTPGDDTYWQDGSYVPASITGGQKVSYASDDHSAIAISSSVYESKWGQAPLMRHAPCYTPYNCSTLNGYQLAGPTGSSNPFKYSNGRDEWLACWGIAGRISSNCYDISDFHDKQLCYAMSDSTQSPCTQMTDRNMQLACYGMSVAPNYPSNCRDITDAGLRDFCYSVASWGSQGSCSGVTNAADKALCQALTYQNTSYCASIADANDRWFCYGTASRNNSYCANIVY